MKHQLLAVKSHQQGRADWMYITQCSSPCNTRVGERMKYIPECAQCTLSSNTMEQRRSLLYLLICCRDAGTIRHIKMNGIKWRFACQQTDMLAGNIILLDFRVVEERTGKIMMRPLRISRISQRRNDTCSGSRICSKPGQWISTCTSKKGIYSSRGCITGKNWHSQRPPNCQDKKGQREEIVLDAAESAAQRRPPTPGRSIANAAAPG
jgi:hypothetical protein